jgi:hypothetical protein
LKISHDLCKEIFEYKDDTYTHMKHVHSLILEEVYAYVAALISENNINLSEDIGHLDFIYLPTIPIFIKPKSTIYICDHSITQFVFNKIHFILHGTSIHLPV